MRRALLTLPAVLLGGLSVAGCSEQSKSVEAENPSPSVSATASVPTRLVRGMTPPDQGVFPDCRGRFGDGSVVDYSVDPTKPSKLPQDPNVVLEKYFAEQRARARPEAPLYVLRNFERHDAKRYRGSAHPEELARHGRWIGYRPDDGSVFSVVLMDRAGTDGGWVVAGDEGCSAKSPADRSATPTPT